MTTITTEAIFIPIDLEASLGKIEDNPMRDNDDMDCEPIARTSNNPFNEDNLKKDHHIISPYPLSETYDEIRERQRLTDQVGDNWSLTGKPESERQSDWIELELIPADDAEDDFSMTSEEAGSLNEDDLELERIEDPVSFWEAGFPSTSTEQPNIIPFSVSFSSGCDALQPSKIEPSKTADSASI
jgi:hypothetical protein